MPYTEATKVDLAKVVRDHGYRYFPEPITLASGEKSHDFLDCKKALESGSDLKTASQAVLDVAADRGIEFDAVGGLTLGADPLTFGVAMLSGCDWFIVRKATKNRGTNKLVEGCALGPQRRVLLVDDVATTGGSILQAYDAIVETGAQVVLAVVLADRGELTAPKFENLGVPYASLVTYKDLDIVPVRGNGDLQPA